MVDLGNRGADIAKLLSSAELHDPEDPISLLCDALALACSEVDAYPPSVFDRVMDSFDRFHKDKYLGRVQ